VAVTRRSSACYRHWPFRCCSSPEAAWEQPKSQAQAEATPEPSWEPGEAMADMDFEAEI